MHDLQLLKRRIASFWPRLKHDSLFYQRALAGHVTGKEVGRLLAGTKHLIERTPLFLGRAIEKAQVLGDEFTGLVDYYRAGKREEVGHDRWAAHDLRVLREHFDDVQVDVVDAVDELVAFIDGLIERDVVLLLAYILWAEYLVVIAAPEFAVLLKDKCGVPQQALTVFLRHAELDKEHTSDERMAIGDVLAAHPRYLEPFLSVIDEASRIYTKFWNSISQ